MPLSVAIGRAHEHAKQSPTAWRDRPYRQDADGCLGKGRTGSRRHQIPHSISQLLSPERWDYGPAPAKPLKAKAT